MRLDQILITVHPEGSAEQAARLHDPARGAINSAMQQPTFTATETHPMSKASNPSPVQAYLTGLQHKARPCSR